MIAFFCFSSAFTRCRRSFGVKQIYNKVARTLVAFEYLWYQAWVQSIEQAKAGLQVRLNGSRTSFQMKKYTEYVSITPQRPNKMF